MSISESTDLPAGAGSDPGRRVRSRATFRLPVAALLFPALLLFCAIPLASYRVWFAPIYLIPVAALAYVLLTSTTVTSETITARTLLTRRRIPWAELDGFEFRGPRWALAVTTAGRRFRLPMVRPRDLPVLAAVSGGRLNLRPTEPEPVPADPPTPETDGEPTSPETAARPGSEQPAAAARPAAEPPAPAATAAHSAAEPPAADD